ncbi:primosomal protein N' [Coprococcus catus]|uniref:Replication restart protein PriA n=2 Tax=Coprococcus catus TaxID=116085 RepID=A0A3E2XQK7_9FIRM|nr:primosomal protein N' [Coprococcus catus]RGC50357.1 primosomal protein N' [Coprococcus catus]CBK81159.1 replication restart DNA helicase PriA [Coprococcus catus GD/7]
MAVYIDVIVDISVNSLDRIFQYRVPEKLLDAVTVGCQVNVPFGSGNRRRQAYVIGVDTVLAYDASKIKDILGVTKAPAATGQLIALADWMHERYGCTMAQALKTVLPVKKSVKEVKRTAYFLADREGAQQLLEKSRKSRREKARVRLLEAMLKEGCMSKETVTGVLQISASTMKSILQTGVIREETSQVYRNPVRQRLDGWQEVCLNDEQMNAVASIWQNAAICREHWSREQGMHLLYGITGSGKTEVYMALMEKVLNEGRQIIVLIPEISLTLQTVSRFYARFGSQIAVMNSRLSAGERYDQYMRAKRGEASIMIGPRSALFTPFDRLGLIIIDEEHESAYQSEIVPRYQAAEVAARRAEMSGALVVLGSATPSVAVYQKAREGMIGLHRLTQRARTGSRLPDVKVVDLREEFRMKNRGILSQSLHEAMDACLKRGDQMMLFLNRRGYAGFVSCRSCGYVVKCRHCDVSMTVHHHTLLKCHYCGSEQPMPRVCPSCGSPYIAGFGVGTQKVEEFVQKEFPEARILRMDRDTTSGKDDMGRILQTFSEGGADILIGTQMIVKGHDFANVTLVGILAADLSLFAGDYQSSERTFQLLTQAAGRAGRGDRPGEVIIQTYQPEHYCIQTAAAQDYDSFYSQEIRFRQMLHYPPDRQMMVMLAEGEHDQQTGQAVQKLREIAGEADFEAVEFIGPSRAGIAKAKDLYRYTMYMKHQDIKELMRLRDFLEGYLKWSQQFSNIYFTFDIRES